MNVGATLVVARAGTMLRGAPFWGALFYLRIKS